MTRLDVTSDPTVPAPRSGDTAPGDTTSPPPTGAEPDVVTVRVVGDLDAASAGGWVDLLTTAVQDAAATTGVGRATSRSVVACDLGAVGFLSAAGVTALLEVTALATARGVPYSVVAASGPVRRVLDLTATTTAVAAAPGAGRP